jgi:hypothetical protein
MTPITYTISEAAKILRCKEENILYMGSNNFWKICTLPSSFNLFYIELPFNIGALQVLQEFDFKIFG